MREEICEKVKLLMMEARHALSVMCQLLNVRILGCEYFVGIKSVRNKTKQNRRIQIFFINKKGRL